MFSRHGGVTVRPTLKGAGALQYVDGVVGGLAVGVPDRSGGDGVAFGEVKQAANSVVADDIGRHLDCDAVRLLGHDGDPVGYR